LVVFRATLVYHDDMLNQSCKHNFNPALPTGGILFYLRQKKSTIVEKHEKKYTFCLMNDHQHHEDKFDTFCYSDKVVDDVRQTFDLLCWD
jgi:hypothetical protein